MASASGEKKGKPRQSKTHQAPRKARSAKSTPLNAQRDATRKRDLQRKIRERSERGRGNGAGPLSNGFDVLGLIGRRTTAVLELPMGWRGVIPPSSSGVSRRGSCRKS